MCKAIKKEDGYFEKAMVSCNGVITTGDGKKTTENKLIESTVEGAGFEGENAKRVVGLTKSFIGDTIIKTELPL